MTQPWFISLETSDCPIRFSNIVYLPSFTVFVHEVSFFQRFRITLDLLSIDTISIFKFLQEFN